MKIKIKSTRIDDHFRGLKDPRIDRIKLHSLIDIISGPAAVFVL